MNKPCYAYKCIAPGCEKDNFCLSKEKGLSFHRFPKDCTLRTKWVAAMGIPSDQIKTSSRICSNHFTNECYEHQLDALVNIDPIYHTRKLLKRDAVPRAKRKLVDLTSSRNSVEISVNDSTINDINSDAMELENIPSPAKSSLSRKKARSLDSYSPYRTVQTESVGIQSVLHPPSTSRGIQAYIATPSKNNSTQTTKRQSNKSCQAFPKVHDKGTQTIDKYDALVNEFIVSRTEDVYDYEEINDGIDGGEEIRDPLDTSFSPSSLGEDDVFESRKDHGAPDDRKYIVFETALLQLFVFCTQCLSKCTAITSVSGTMITVQTSCPNNHSNIWRSQPLLGRKPAGNIIVASAMLFAGLNPEKTLRMFRFANIATFDLRTFYRMQKAYLFRAIDNVWKNNQETLLRSLKGQDLILGADGRCDSPGFCAKYGSYCFMENKIKKVIHLVLLQSNQVKNSVAMELEGCKRGLEFLKNQGLNIGYMVTDRHKQIRCYLRTHHKDIVHLFDVWHLVKSVKSKIAAACGKKKSMEILLSWSKSIQNHLYWIANSSGGVSELMQAKWCSILRHVVNLHTGHEPPFEACEHKELVGERPRKWMKKTTEAYVTLSKIINNLTKDIGQLAWVCQTSSVEAFNAVVIQFAPKHTHYSFLGMKARLTLAALHYNENSTKMQATTKNGKRRWNIFFPKFKSGEYSVRPIMMASTYEYVEDLMEMVTIFANAETYGKGNELSIIELGETPEPLASKYDKPNKDEAVASYEKSKRFHES